MLAISKMHVILCTSAAVICGAFTLSRKLAPLKLTCSKLGPPEASLHMALAPIGPLCPFRSSAAIACEPRYDELTKGNLEFMNEIAKVQLDLQFGSEPDRKRLFLVADGIDDAVSKWERLLTRLNMSGDFQNQEFAKLLEARFASSGLTPVSVASMMRWQGACMRAMALNAPPPMPPASLDLQQLMKTVSGPGEEAALSITRMSCAQAITCSPFDMCAFKTEALRLEYEVLCRDHRNLIELGARYSSFDPSGRIAFLDEVESIEDRWDDFLTRCDALGALNPEFSKQCQAFLISMSLCEDDYRSLLRKSHDIMRLDAEERGFNLSC